MTTVVLLFHPNFEQSRVNQALITGLDDDISVRNMYKIYPDFKINPDVEQHVMESADRIVFQFPMYWYSSPALLKQWEDTVLDYGWAYGVGGDALHGKELVVAVTPGAKNYGRDGFAKYTIHELLRPYQNTSRLIGMEYAKPFITIGASNINDNDLQTQVKQYNEYLHQDKLTVLGDFE